MQIGCNKDLVCLSAEVLCQLTRTAKRKRMSDAGAQSSCSHSLYFWGVFFSASQKRASKSLYVFFIIFLSLWTFFLSKFLWSFFVLSVFEASPRFSKLWCTWTRGNVASNLTHDPCHKLPSQDFHIKNQRLSPPKKTQHWLFIQILGTICLHIFLISDLLRSCK